VRRLAQAITRVVHRQRTLTARACAAWLALACCALPGLARAAEPVDVVVRARVDRERGEIAGALLVRARVAEGERSVRLWVYADRLAVAPRAMDEQSYRWIFPGERDLGRALVEQVRVDGRAVTPRVSRGASGTDTARDARGATLEVPIDAGAARIVELRLRFRVTVPRRFGRLGRVDEELALAAPWYPLVVTDDAWDFRVPQHVEVEVVDGSDVVAGDGPIGHGRTAHDAVAPYVPLLVAPRLREELRAVPEAGDAEAPDLRVVMLDPRAGFVRDLLDVERLVIDERAVDRVARALEEVSTAMRVARLPVRRASVTVLVVPSRTELASVAPGVVLLSDRFGEVSPIDATGRFHERAAARALLRLLVAPLSTERDAPADRPWADDLRATLLSDVDEARRHGHALTPQEILGFAAFHPAVDQLLYAPQVPFPDVYFGSVDELDRFRDDPMRAFAPTARGRRLLESARDAHGDAFAGVAEALLRGPGSARAALAVGEVEPGRIAQWLAAPTHPVNYRLGAVTTTRERGGYAHRIEVLRDVPPGDPQPVEPVEVQAEDDDGRTVLGRWDGRGPRGVVTLRTRAPLDEVMLDPRQRLPQSPALTDGHPRADDATTQPFRLPLLQGLMLSYSAAEQRLDGLIDFAVRRRYDLDTALGLRLSTGAAATGGIVRWLRGVGPKRDTNSRVGVVSAGLEVERLHGGFATLAADGTAPVESDRGWSAALLFAGGFDTRTFRPDPRYGVSLGVSLRFGGVARDDGSFSGSAAAAVRGSITLPIGTRNALLLVAGAGVTLGRPLPGEQQALGGLGVMRGFRSNELLGGARAYVVAEHRYTLVADLAWNILGAVYVRELQLGIFAGAGALMDPVGASAAQGKDVLFVADAGGGLRVHFDYGGVQPAVLILDVAAPITGGQGHGVAPYIAFDQYF
jgi:hypothetical protein